MWGEGWVGQAGEPRLLFRPPSLPPERQAAAWARHAPAPSRPRSPSSSLCRETSLLLGRGGCLLMCWCGDLPAARWDVPIYIPSLYITDALSRGSVP